MKKFFSGILLCLFVNLSANETIVSTNSPEITVNKPLTETMEIWNHPALIKLLEYSKIEHDGTPKSIVEQTQKHWLRTVGKERWEIEEIKTDDAPMLMECFTQLGLVNEKKVSGNPEEVKGTLVLGATATPMKIRTATALNLNSALPNQKTLTFLCGQRPRNEELETENTFILKKNDPDIKVKKNWEYNGVAPKTETEIMKLIFDQISLPRNFTKKMTTVFIDAPMQKNNDGSLRRPNTGDTIKEWLNTNPEPGKYIFVSNNPYIKYQEAVIRTYIPKQFTFEVIGRAASKKERLVIYFDTLARWLFQEQIILNKQ